MKMLEYMLLKTIIFFFGGGVKIKDVQDGLGIKNMSDRLKITNKGICESKNITKERKKCT